MQNEIYYNQIMINLYLEYVLEYSINERKREVDNYNY